MIHRLRRLLEGLQVHPERMRENLNSTRGLVFSQPVLLALVQAGLTRDDAYRIVQSAAATASSSGADFRTTLARDPQVAALPASVLDDAFDLRRSLAHVSRIFDQLPEVG
jgi:adenylosuccinate lyase